jgi:hypothetical protein
MEQINNRLQVLTGLPLWDAQCFAQIVWFQFGQSHYTLNIDGTMTRKVGDYVLHIQGRWYISDASGATVIEYDPSVTARYEPQKPPYDENGDLTDQDERINRFLGAWAAKAPIVEQVHVDQTGNIQLQLTGHYTLTTSLETAEGDDHWRLGQPLTQIPDIVVYKQSPPA